MSELNSMSRESKKRRLRKQIVSSASQSSHPGSNGQDREKALSSVRQKIRRRGMLACLILVLAVGVGSGFWHYTQRNYRYSSYETVWTLDINEGSLVGYEPFGTNVLKYTKDGASYMDNKGKNVWTESYEMKTPIVSVQGDYAAIGDSHGNRIYIYNLDGSQGQVTTALPIRKIAVTGTGIVTAVLEDATSSYITFFKKDGSPLDIAIKTKMEGDGYPLDIALSNDGTRLMCSYIYIYAGEIKNRVVFYDFSEVGKNVANRLVGGFDKEFTGTIVPCVVYMDEPFSCAFSGAGPVFFSSKNLASPEVISQITMEEEVQSVFYSKEYAAVIVKNMMGEFANRMEVYKKDGTHVLSKEFNYEYTEADIDGDWIILYNEDSCRIFNTAGTEKLYTTFDFAVSQIRRGRFPNTLVVTGPQQMREIKLR